MLQISFVVVHLLGCACGAASTGLVIRADAYSGQYQATYLVPFVAIAGIMRTEYGFPNYQVLRIAG